ncbi:disease resistance TIR-NBS-LRR class family protein [Tanacetum coccineum]
MASTSTMQKSFKYDVFLSFRGEDTRNSFVGHLFQALKEKGIETYKDDEKIEQGKKINYQLMRSIQESRFFIIVFSKTYASSSWCLDELVKIIECQKKKKTGEQTAYPVFFDVEPTQVRKQSGPVKEAFAELEKKEAAEKWREAMKEASGMEMRKKEVLSSLDIGTNDVRVIGIKGIGDDVDHSDQLEVLVGDLDYFKSGSRIIITTRDEQVLVSHGVSLICNVNLLTDDEAVCLFRRYAFGKEISNQGFNEIELEWKDALERLKKVPENETQEILKISYDALENDYKEIFLDVACILKGEQKDKAIRVLESCGFHGRIGLRVLEQKCLINISQSGTLGMHDLIEEMGKTVVLRSNTNEPNRDSRLLIEEKNEDILDNDLKVLRNMKKLRVLYMCTGANWSDSRVSQCFPNALQYLSWRSYPFWSLQETFQADNLVGLDMSFSSVVQIWEWGKRKVLNKLRFLDLSYSNLTTLNLEVTPKLEILNLEHCTDLEELYIPNGCPKLQYLNLDFSKLRNLRFGPTPDLETLSLGGCSYLQQLHMPGCPKLKVLKLDGPEMRTLDLGLTLDLETLSIEGCNLAELHMPRECPKLKFISFHNSKLRKLNLGLTPDLETLCLGGCCNLILLHMPFQCLKLNSLSLANSKLRTLDLGLTPNLERLDLKDCSNLSKPLKFGFLSELHLIGESIGICPLHPDNSFPKFQFTCSYKEDLAASSFGNLKKLISIELQMPDESLNLEYLTLSHLKLKTIQLRNTPNLKELILKDLEINAPNGFLFSIVLLALSGCGRFKIFRFDKQLNLNHSKKQLTDSLSELHLIAETIDVCQLHPDNSFPKFRFECYYNEAPASSFGNLEMLISMGLCACTNLENFSRSICSLEGLRKLTLEGSIPEVPRDLDQLESLEELIFSSSNIRNLPDSICKLKHLKSLELKSCLLLEKLPDDLGRIESLETLTITDCSRLRDIPNNIGKIKCVVSPKVLQRNTQGNLISSQMMPLTEHYPKVGSQN